MRVAHLGILLTVICFFACKKNNYDPPAYINTLNQSVSYKTIATIPSPSDSANGTLRDSLFVSRTINRGEIDFLTNITGVSSNLANNYPGFSFGYENPNLDIPHFIFAVGAFPDVSQQFEVNRLYEHHSVRGTQYDRPFFLGSSNGYTGMTYFVNNEYPPDAGARSSRTYTSIKFSKKFEIPRASDILLFASGSISGYCIDYYYPSDTTRYVQRWDFTVDFTDLKIDP